jgi:hypothetical protein
MPMKAYVSKDGQQNGPYSVEQLQEYLRQGNFTAEDLACYDGRNWVTVAQVPGLATRKQPATPPEQSPAGQQRAVQKPRNLKKQTSPTKKGSMKAGKQQYLNQIRTNTSYPTYRGIIGIIAILGYLLAALNGLAVLISGFMIMGDSFIAGVGVIVGGLLIACLIFLGARFGKEAALIIADIGDSTIETNSKSS